MHKWEYLCAVAYRPGLIAWVNEKPVQPAKQSTYEFLSQMGNEGWELVSAQNSHDAENADYFYFKRPKLPATQE